VHQFSGKIDLSGSQEVSGTLVSYVAKMGVDPRLVSIASSASPENVHFLTAQELAVFKITVDDDAFGPWEIKPFGSGVVAISETPDHGKAAMLVCAQDGAPRLVIADKVFGDGKDLQDAVSGLTGVDALGLKLPGRNASVVKGDDGAPLLEISLTGLDLRKTFSAQDLGVDVGNYAPHAVWGWLGYTFNTQNAAESFRVALRNCI
jgi:hypothetical protein